MKLRNVPGWNFMEYVLVRAAAAFLALLPASAAASFSGFLGSAIYLLSAKRRKTALENLETAFGASLPLSRKKEIARKSLAHTLFSIFEFFNIPRVIKKSPELFSFEGTEHLDQAFKKGKGVIGVISHLGSWEYLAFLPFLRGYPCSVVVRDIKNPHIHAWLRRLRKMTKLNPIDRKSSLKEILRELRANHYVALLIDQWAGHDGLWLDFFGKPTSTTSVPARLAMKTGAALVPMHCVRGVKGYKITIFPEVPLKEEKETTLELNRVLEREILKYPEQWIWSHRRWKDQWRHIRGL